MEKLYITKGQVVHGAWHMHTQTDTQTDKLIKSGWSRNLQRVKMQSLQSSLIARGEIIKEKSNYAEGQRLTHESENGL